MVGNSVCQALKGHDLLTPSKQELNVTRLEQIMRFKTDYIIHLASETDHEYCDENPAQCYLVNTIGTANMMRLAKSLHIPIIYISTASVFDGKKLSPYEIHDVPNPINHYNASKYYGEILCLQHSLSYILRCGWMFGGGKGLDKKFVAKLVNKINVGQKEIKVCTDCIGSPTYSVDVAHFINRVISNKPLPGIIHCANKSNGVSRYEFACEVVRILNAKVNIIPCKIDDLKDEFPCKRTNYEVLSNNQFMPDWKQSLKDYLCQY